MFQINFCSYLTDETLGRQKSIFFAHSYDSTIAARGSAQELSFIRFETLNPSKGGTCETDNATEEVRR